MPQEIIETGIVIVAEETVCKIYYTETGMHYIDIPVRGQDGKFYRRPVNDGMIWDGQFHTDIADYIYPNCNLNWYELDRCSLEELDYKYRLAVDEQNELLGYTISGGMSTVIDSSDDEDVLEIPEITPEEFPLHFR